MGTRKSRRGGAAKAATAAQVMEGRHQLQANALKQTLGEHQHVMSLGEQKAFDPHGAAHDFNRHLIVVGNGQKGDKSISVHDRPAPLVPTPAGQMPHPPMAAAGGGRSRRRRRSKGSRKRRSRKHKKSRKSRRR